MQSSTIIRKTDKLGRLVIPREFRKILKIKFSDPVEINRCGKLITIRKSIPNCIFCDESEALNEYKDRKVCNNCIDLLMKIKKVMVRTSLILNNRNYIISLLFSILLRRDIKPCTIFLCSSFNFPYPDIS